MQEHQCQPESSGIADAPLEVIACATKTGAEIMGRDKEFGAIAAGKLADILIVDDDVLADISLLPDRTRFIAVR